MPTWPARLPADTADRIDVERGADAAAPARASASAGRTSRRTCTWPARRPTSTTCPSCRHAARGARPVAGRARPARRRSTSTRIRATARRGRRASPPPTSPARNDCGPIVHDDPILADGAGALPRPAGVRGHRDDRDDSAPRRGAGEGRADDRAAAAGPHRRSEAHAAAQYVLPPMHLRARRCGARRRSPRAPHRLDGTLDVGGQEQFYLEGQISYAIPQEDGGMLVHCSTQHPTRDAAPGRACAGAAVAPRAGGMPAHGRRLRRQGVAVGAVRLHRRARRARSWQRRSSCASTATTTS